MKIYRVLLIVIAIVWLFAVTLAYYFVHKPFSADNALALLDTFANLLTAGAIFLLALAIGQRVTWTFRFASTLDAICLRAGLGLGLLSFLTFGLGLLGLLNSILFWALLLASFFLLRGEISAILRDFRGFRAPFTSRFDIALAAFIAATLFIALAFALTPPIAWDAQTYHLVKAKAALELGRIVPPPDIVYFSFPSLGEMLFLAAMLLKGDIAAQLTHFGFFLLTLGAVFSFAQRYFTTTIAWLAVALLLAVPSFLLVAIYAYVDATLAFYAFAAFYALMIAFDTNETRWYALAGAFAGLAANVKYTALIVPVAIFILIMFQNRARRLPYAISYLLPAICFVLPFYLRNLFFTGNPVYPFFLGGPFWDAFRADWFSRFGTGLMTTPLKILTAPWDATIFGIEGSVDYSATIGPLLLALLPLWLIDRKSTNADQESSGFDVSVTKSLFLFSLILYLFWLVGIVESKLLIQTRLLFPAFPALAILAAVALDRLAAFDHPKFSLHRFARMLVALVFLLTFTSVTLAFAANNPLAYITGAVSRDKFLDGALGDYYRATHFINTQLPTNSKTLALWEPRSYYINRAIQPDAILDIFPHQLWQTRDPDAIGRAWQSAGYTHVLLSRRGLNVLFTSQYDPISLADVRVLQTLLAQRARLIYGEPLETLGKEIANAERAPYAIYALEPPTR